MTKIITAWLWDQFLHPNFSWHLSDNFSLTFICAGQTKLHRVLNEDEVAICVVHEKSAFLIFQTLFQCQRE